MLTKAIELSDELKERTRKAQGPLRPDRVMPLYSHACPVVSEEVRLL